MFGNSYLHNVATMSMNTFPLEEKICMITGGLGGIALGVAKLILKRGGKVFLCDVKSQGEGEEVLKKELQQNPENSCYAKCDVTLAEDLEGKTATIKN